MLWRNGHRGEAAWSSGVDADSVQALRHDPGCAGGGGSIPIRLAGVRASPAALLKDGNVAERWPASGATLRLLALYTACVSPSHCLRLPPPFPNYLQQPEKRQGSFLCGSKSCRAPDCRPHGTSCSSSQQWHLPVALAEPR